jgi:hypothetical protein
MKCTIHKKVEHKDKLLCCNLSFGFVTKVRACKGAAQEWRLGVTFHVPRRLRIWESVKIEPPHSQVNSHFEGWSLDGLLNLLKNDCKGQNPLDCGVSYIIGKLLEHKYLKWACMTHLKIWNKLWPKKGWESYCQIWFPTTKSQEEPQFSCVQMACNIVLESFRKGLQLCFKLHEDWRSAHKVMAPQSRGNPNFGN